MLGSLLLALSTTLFPQAAPGQRVSPLIPAEHFAPVTVPFEYFNRHIFIDLTLNGKTGMVFMLDSGTNCNILSMRTSEALGLKPVSIQQKKGLGLGSGKVKIAAAKDIDASIGGIQVANLMAIVDLEALEHHFGHHIDGILGFPFLRNFVVVLDFDKHVLTLLPSKRYAYRGPGDTLSISSKSKSTCIHVMLGLAGHKQHQAKLEIDTGSDVTLLLYSHYVHGARLEGIFPTQPPHVSYGLGGYFTMQLGVLYSLSMGRTEASNLSIFQLKIDSAMTQKGFDGLIGTALLDRFQKVVFDVPRGHVMFELKPADQISANQPAVPPRQ
ncbi:MAG TPA: retropepsin-like aspartic protease [Acidobacteriaceae bacterium]|nr:retropepsin-like aspartic protease [Acidobacteriaceae bacterium]